MATVPTKKNVFDQVPAQPHLGETVTLDNIFINLYGNVIGQGSYVVGAGTTLGFMNGVSTNETIVLSNQHRNGIYGASKLNINDPDHFYGHVDLTYKTPPAFVPKSVKEQSNFGLLMSSAKQIVDGIDHYSFKNDMLKLWDNGKVVEQISLTVHDPYGITVQNTPGNWVFVSANTATAHGLDFVHGHPSAMPVHHI